VSSVALAATFSRDSAVALVEAMLTALEDRSPEWTVSGNTPIALGSGGPDKQAVNDQLVNLPDAEIGLAVDGPAWTRELFDSTIDTGARRTPTEALTALLDLFSCAWGDVHCVGFVGSRCCVAYRGAMSSRPLFYSATEDGTVLVASQIRAIRAARATTISVAGLAPFLIPQLCDTTGTAWTDIHRLPPGYVLIARDATVETREVTRVNAIESGSATRGELVAEFRRRLMLAIERSSEPPDGILLSGGIDSSALACAYSAIRDGGHAYSLTYDHQLAPCDERRFVDDVEQATGMAVDRLPANRLLPLVAGFPEGDEPEPWAYAARNWGMLEHIARDPARKTATIIAGEGGDELLLGQVFSVADRYALGDVDGATNELATFPDPAGTERVIQALLRGDHDRTGTRVMRALSEIPAWLSTGYVTESGIVDRLAAEYPQLGEPGEMTVNYSRAILGEMGAAGRVQCGGWWEDMGRKAGLKITYPFLDPDLTALVWSLPPQLLRDQGLEKVVLRESLADLLPPSVAQRGDKAEALALMHAGLTEAIDTVRAVAHRGPLVDHGVIHSDKLLGALDRYLTGDLKIAPALWATVAVNQWMTQQFPDRGEPRL
jgi:asparagine synthase (glutamine-hydrolysing)